MRTTRSHGTLLEGECDFILLEPERGLLFVEVKGGSLVFDGEKWVREVGAERRELNKDPFAQAQRGMHDIVDIVRGRYGATANGLPFTYGFAVAFPDCRVSGWLPPSIQRELILDAAKLRAVPDSLRRIFASFVRRDDRALHSDEVASVREALYPKYRLVPVLWRKIEDQEERLRRLTDEQQRILDILAQRPKAAISGVAGSGKTLLALAKAQAMARQGFHTLLLCFNRPLKDWLCDSVPQEFGGKLVIDNYHGLADDLCRAAGVPMWERGDTDDPEFWSEVVPVALDEACTRLGPEHKFDAIVVDEGQDFQDLWWESLQSVFRDAANKACYYVFYDPKQNLFVDHPGLPDELVVEQTCNDVSVVAGVFLARRGREVVPGYVEWAQRGEGRTGDHPKGAPTNAHLLCCRLSTYARYAFEATPRIWTLVDALTRHYKSVRPLGPPYLLPTNCRNTVRIAAHCASLVGHDNQTRDDAPLGEEPEMVGAATVEDAVRAAGKRVRELCLGNLGGLKPSQVAVLAPASADGLWPAKFATIPLTRDFEEWRRDKGVLIATLGRFKGLEADAVVIVEAPIRNEARRTTSRYVARSRAKHLLTVIEAAAV